MSSINNENVLNLDQEQYYTSDQEYTDNTQDDDGDEESYHQVNHEFENKRVTLQRFTIYNSISTMYIVGSNSKESLFRIIEISKDQNDNLIIIEDKNFFYTRKDMIELLNSLNDTIDGGIHKLAQGSGLLGFIKFTKDYYLCLITKCSQVAILGGHFIYHIDETKLIPLGTTYKRPEKYSDEERLLSIFKYMDLGKTFYFSYSYDITNTLQTNFMRHKLKAYKMQFGKVPSSFQNELYSRFDHNERFVWNSLLLKPILEGENNEIATYEWFQRTIHGFIDEAKISIYGRSFYICLIARRSKYFAGARFLKRGVNDKGNVANEIETEQIVSDMLTSSFHDSKHGFFNNSRYTSFVQYRGSIPLFWTQDMNKLPKPPIQINLPDPFYQSSALHFNNLFYRYGSPIIILNLNKQKEKQPRESKLNVHYSNCITYLNQFLPKKHKLQLHSFDMSKHSKKNLDVIGPLQKIAKSSIKQIQVFHNGHNIESTKLQKGIIRTNCIDCLDRTNAAQFIICKEALTLQLQELEIISSSKNLDYDSDLINILTEMFHDHGDTIAIQYGGSNLVNTMDSYRRINQWSSHTRDMLNSIKRIYSNSFMDSIRQEAINLFLGNYIYDPNKPKLWELQNDFALHNDSSMTNLDVKRSYTHWFNEKYLNEARFDTNIVTPNVRLEPYPDSNEKWFNECYVPKKYQPFTDLFQFNMNSNSRYFPNDNNTRFDYSPFESRKRNDKKAGESEIKYLEGTEPNEKYPEPEIKYTESIKCSGEFTLRPESTSSDSTSITVNDSDLKLYQTQFEFEKIVKLKPSMLQQTRFKPSLEDVEKYKYCSKEILNRIRDSHIGNYLDCNLISAESFKLYWNYSGNDDRLDLETDNNYFI
ncbi:unnamed protein product [Candida verbasci]|uniref:SAC domain-containing protein n=1 Tax=Candida verbasci TaxID=1227364 RepID=A0A9W4U298_9ASCO|nr:unnamed protein product [Candida verbasci]